MPEQLRGCAWCGNATLHENKCEKFNEPLFYARLKMCANFEGYVATTQVPIPKSQPWQTVNEK